jgi:predicted dehydrogenase
MDTGCYAVSMLRHLAGSEPEVLRAEAKLSSPDVDRYMHAEMRFADGASGAITCSLLSSRLLSIHARVAGTRGRMSVFNPVAPHIYHRLAVRSETGRRAERVKGDTTYTHQLRAFVAHVRGGPAMASHAWDAVANMRVIDAIYDRSGMKRRGG